MDEEADINGNEEEAQVGEKVPTRAEGIFTWHGWRQRVCIVCRVAPFLITSLHNNIS